MRKFIKAAILMILLAAQFPNEVSAETAIPINDLIENAKALDGQEVTVCGEAIGERMDRREGTWININDGTNAIGIWLKNTEADQIQYYGNYKYKGAAVEIKGVFHKACKEHGGEADVHCNAIAVIKEGYQVNEQISNAKIFSVGILLPAALLMIVLYRKRTKMESI